MIQKLKDDELLQAAHKAVHDERMQTLKVIAYLEEIYARRLHLKRGYGSFQAFLVGEKLYNEGCAHRRVSAMKLVQDMPEARAALGDGRLSLTTAAVVEQFFKTERVEHKKTYSIEEKSAILEKVARASVKRCAQVLAQVSPTYTIDAPVVKLTDDAELRALLEEFRVLSMSAKDDATVLVKSALKTAIKMLKAKEAKASLSIPMPSLISPKLSNSRPAFTKPSSAKVRCTRHIPKQTQRRVWQNDHANCSFIDATTGRKCDSVRSIEIDHIIPYSHEGTSSLENLRLLCRAHHGLLSSETFSTKFASKAIHPLADPSQTS